jgi:hypothetical protein
VSDVLIACVDGLPVSQGDRGDLASDGGANVRGCDDVGMALDGQATAGSCSPPSPRPGVAEQVGTGSQLDAHEVSNVAAILLIAQCYASGGIEEREGRKRLQNGDSQHNLPTTSPLNVYASHSGFQSIARDLGSCREMPDFALSRRQRGFEPRWGHKIEPRLTRPDTATTQSA